MKVYLYAKSGHNIGLDAIRRCSVIAKLLQESNCEPILCTCDFRAGIYAKSHLGINHYLSIQKVEELSKLIEKGDILIYDSDENKEFFNSTLKSLCTLIYKIPEDIPYTIIDKQFFTKQINHNTNKLFYFSSNDYEGRLLDICKGSGKKDITLLWGHFFFSNNKNKLSSYFEKIIEEENYIKTIKNTKFLLSASLHTCIESLTCGNKPVLFKRDDKKYDERLIKSLHLPTIKEKPFEEAFKEFEKIIDNYPKINSLEEFDLSSIIHDIFVRIETFRKLSQ